MILVTYRYTRKIYLFDKFDFDIDVGSVLEVNVDSLRNLRDEQRNGDQHDHQPRTPTTRKTSVKFYLNILTQMWQIKHFVTINYH